MIGAHQCESILIFFGVLPQPLKHDGIHRHLMVLFSCELESRSIGTGVIWQDVAWKPFLVSWGNLPGWRWARIKQLALVGLSSSRHSEVCNALGCPSGVAHSIISVHGISRPRGCQQPMRNTKPLNTIRNHKMPISFIS